MWISFLTVFSFAERGLLEQLPADGLALPLAPEGRDEGPAHLVAQWHGPHPPPPSLLTRYDHLFPHVDYIPQPSRASYIYPSAMSQIYIYPYC